MKILHENRCFFLFITFIVPNLLPTRHIYFKIHTEYINLYH
jgi:hypothetical protein